MQQAQYKRGATGCTSCDLSVEQVDHGADFHLHTGSRQMLVDELLMWVTR
jgi:hypothetical protein